MIRDRELRIKVLGILYERCSNLIDELMEVANVTVVSQVVPQPDSLDLGEVI